MRLKDFGLIISCLLIPASWLEFEKTFASVPNSFFDPFGNGWIIGVSIQVSCILLFMLIVSKKTSKKIRIILLTLLVMLLYVSNVPPLSNFRDNLILDTGYNLTKQFIPPPTKTFQNNESGIGKGVLRAGEVLELYDERGKFVISAGTDHFRSFSWAQGTRAVLLDGIDEAGALRHPVPFKERAFPGAYSGETGRLFRNKMGSSSKIFYGVVGNN